MTETYTLWLGKTLVLPLLFIYCFFVSPACAAPSPLPEKLETVTLQLKCLHQFQFAGYYAAAEKGFYADEGLKVIIKERDPTQDYLQTVISGEAEYGITDSGLVLLRAKGSPVVILSQIFQHSPLIFISKKNSGIISPYEMIGKNIMYDQMNAALVAMLRETIGGESSITPVPLSFSMDSFINGEIDVRSAYLTLEPYQLKEQGVPVNIINPQNYGVDFYGDNLFTTENEVNEHPKRVEKMIRATLKGWQYALAHPDEIIDIMEVKYPSLSSRETLEYEAKITKMMIMPDLITLGSINPQRFEKIIATYARLGLSPQKTVPPGFFFQPKYFPEVTLTQPEQAWLIAHPEIQVANELDWPPFSFVRQDRAQGFSVEYLNLIAKKTGLRVKYVFGYSWSELLELGRSKKIDLLHSIVKTENRSRYLDFSKSYLENPSAIFMRRGSKKITSIGDIAGQRIAVVQGYYHEEIIKRLYPQIKLITVQSSLEGLKGVSLGQVDAFIDEVMAANYILTQNMLSNVVAVGPTGLTGYEGTVLRFAAPDDRKILIDIIEKGMAAISEQEKFRLLNKWMVLPTKQTLLLSDEESAWLRAHPHIRLGVDPSLMPLEFKDDDGVIKGIAMDYLHAVEQQLDIRFEMTTDLPWQELIGRAKDRNIDMFSCIVQTPERNSYLTFTAPYVTSPIVIFGRAEMVYIGDLSGLKGQKVTVLKDFAIHEFLARNHPEISLIPMTDMGEALKQVTSGKAVAYIGSLITTSHYISSQGYTPLIKVVGQTPYKSSLAMATRNDWPIFAGILQKALANINQKTRNEIYHKWISVNYETGVNATVIWKIIAGAIFVIVGFVFWNRKLKTEVNRHTKALRVNKKRYRDLYYNAQVGLVRSTITEGKLLSCNDKLAKILGYDSRQDCIDHFITSEHYVDQTARQVMITLLLKQGRLDNYSAQVSKKDGSFIWVEFSCIYHKAENFLDTVLVDITARKQAETALQESEKQLRHTQKMESIGTLAGGIAHDFNNILSAIYGYAELVKEGLPPQSGAREMQNEVLTAAGRARDLVKQILLFSRQTDHESQLIRPHFIVKEALKLLRASIPTTIEIQQDIHSECGSILADPSQLHQIVMNLCTNAYHAMHKEGGILTVSIYDTEINIADITFDHLELAPGSYVKLQIEDTGHGMDQTTMDKIFNPYFTTKPTGKGTGLGLSVVHGIVKNHNGVIKVSSEPNKGTTMTVYFPRHESGKDTILEKTVHHLPTGQERILLVDDEEQILNVMVKILTSLGYKVTAETNSQKAFKRFNDTPDNFDLIITDMTMPHMTGLELIEQIFQQHPKMPIILCSGFSECISEEKATALGIRRFLVKPVLKKDIAHAIRQALAPS